MIKQKMYVVLREARGGGKDLPTYYFVPEYGVVTGTDFHGEKYIDVDKSKVEHICTPEGRARIMAQCAADGFILSTF